MFIQKFASGVSDDIQKYIMIIHFWGNFFEVYGYGVFMFSYLLTIKVLQNETYKCFFQIVQLLKLQIN